MSDNMVEDKELDFNIELQRAPQLAESNTVAAGEAELTQQKQGFVPKFLSGASQPTFCILHFTFKLSALVLYIVLGMVLSDKTICFIIVTTLCVIDFWVVKNLTGRKLVGLRWWSQIKPDGTEEWIFESMRGDQKANTVDSTVFWLFSYAMPIVWLILAILQLVTFSLNNFFMCMVGCVLGGVNLIGYIRCQKNHKAMVSSYLFQKAKENISPAQMSKMAGIAAQETLKQQFQQFKK